MKLEGFAPLLNVESVSRSLEFYRDYLGFSVLQEWDDDGRVRWALLEASGFRLMLNQPQNADSRSRRNRRAYDDVVLYFTIEDVDSLHAQLQDSGVSVGTLTDEHYGMREFYVSDPDGYQLGFGARLVESNAGE